MGLAVYNSIILDIHFPPVCYRKLLSPAVVPYNNPRATVGVTPVTLRDLEQTLPVCIDLIWVRSSVRDGAYFLISMQTCKHSPTHTHTHARAHTDRCMHTQTHIHTHVNMNARTCTSTHTHTHTHTCQQDCMHTHTHTHKTHMHKCTLRHTHTHTYIHRCMLTQIHAHAHSHTHTVRKYLHASIPNSSTCQQ